MGLIPFIRAIYFSRKDTYVHAFVCVCEFSEGALKEAGLQRGAKKLQTRHFGSPPIFPHTEM